MKSKTLIHAILLILILLNISTISSARVIDRIIAFVNDDIITQRRLDILVNQRAFELQQVYRFSEVEAQEEAEKQRSELLDRLIRQMLLLEAALTLKIQVPETDIEKQIQDFKNKYNIPTDEEFKKLLNRDGLTFESFKEQIQRNLMTEKLVMGRIVPRLHVRDSDVQKFVEENQDQLPTKAERVHLRHIFLAFIPNEEDKKETTEKANTILNEINADKSQFEKIAQRITSDEKAGTLIETTPAELLKFSNISLTTLSKLEQGHISKPVESDDGLHIFMVESRTDNKISFRFMTIDYPISELALKNTREKSVEIIKKLQEGEEFKSLATQFSDDKVTNTKEGDLGIIILKDISPELSEVIQKLDVGMYSDPLETEKGIHIYHVDEKIIPEITAEEKQQIVGILRQQLFEKEWTAYTDTLLENAYIKIKPDAIPSINTNKGIPESN
ncbi:peptidylprolyl isomerase [Candidatus Poribacteria bacterium]|nr:peptidylprolyl isomerase [Candidatus Poribacteria bacterium]